MRPWRVRIALLPLLFGACVARSEPPASAWLSEPPFTLDLRSEPDALTISVLARASRGMIDVSITRDGEARPAIAERLVMRSAAHRYAIDPRSGVTVTARWLDPDGVAGAETVRHVPDIARTAPRFEAITPRRYEGLPIDAAVRIQPRAHPR